ncbi:MAG: hypothetical protein OXU45_00330, partial [Candidatus Melainabacteria bacterium]|nr:hypothetical protein [Candidatus Melainabacteria bacterium]
MDAPLAEQQKFSKQLTKLDFLARKMDKLGLSEEYISDRHPAQIKSLPYWINYLLRRNLQAQNADQILSRALSGELSQADAKKQLLQGVQNSQEPLQDLAAITLAVDKLEELVKQSQAIANGTETEISAAQFYRKINRWQPFHPNLGHDLNELKNYVIDPGLGEQLVFSYKLSSIYCPSETRTTFLQLKEDLQKQGIDLIAWLQTLQKVSVVTFENILADPQKLQGFADFLIEAQQIDQQRELFSKPSLFLSRGMKAYCFLYDFDKYLNFETSRFEDLLTGKTDLRDYVSFLDKLYRSSYQIQRLNLVGPRIQQLPGPFVRRRIVTKLE